jgi:hypothetical protein
MNSLMKGLISILFLSSSIMLQGQSEYLRYPSYEIIINEFFENYSIKDLPGSTQFVFEKRPDGWYITTIDYSMGHKVLKNELFWNKERNKFQNIDFKKSETRGENAELIINFKNDWSEHLYNICPYYGYSGWDWDVIQEYKNATNLPDSVLYAIGRAYSSFASNLLNNNSGFADSIHPFALPYGKNCLTNEQLQEYRYYRHLAIDKYQQLSKLNPQYETIVGTIGIKTSNEYLVSFLDLRMYQNEKEADKEIIDSLYTNFYISTAKNYLNTCDSNSILFTNGDNDTYPLLYVQTKYGFRTDVLVVNMSLLQMDRYINSLRDRVINAPGLPVSLTPEEINGNNREVIIINKDTENEDPLELAELIEFIKNRDHIISYGNIKYFYIPSNSFILSLDKNSIQWKVDKQYFYRNQLILLDILATSNLKRPIYFAITLASDYFFGLTDYFQLEGLAYQLTSIKANDVVNSALTYENFMNKYDWSHINEATSHEKLICLNYRYIFHRLARALIEENKIDSARLVLDKCIELLPNNIVYFDSFSIPLIEDYYEIKEFEKGNKIVKQIAFNLNNGIDNFYDMKSVISSENRNAAFIQLKTIVKKYNQEESIKEFEE